MTPTAFCHPHRVTYADCTLGNHVYYARYLGLLDAARSEFFRHLRQPLLELQSQGTLFPVVECHVRYKSAARFDDVLQIEVWPVHAARVRLSIAYRVFNQNGALILEAETHHACTNLSDKPKRLPADLAAKLASHLRPSTLETAHASLSTRASAVSNHAESNPVACRNSPFE